MKGREVRARIDEVLLPAFAEESRNPDRPVLDAYAPDSYGTHIREQAIGQHPDTGEPFISIADATIIDRNDPVVPVNRHRGFQIGDRRALYELGSLLPPAMELGVYTAPSLTFTIASSGLVRMSRTRTRVVRTVQDVNGNVMRDLRARWAESMGVDTRHVEIGEIAKRMSEYVCLHLHWRMVTTHDYRDFFTGSGRFTAPLRRQDDFENLHRAAEFSRLGHLAVVD